MRERSLLKKVKNSFNGNPNKKAKSMLTTTRISFQAKEAKQKSERQKIADNLKKFLQLIGSNFFNGGDIQRLAPIPNEQETDAKTDTNMDNEEEPT